MSNATHKLCSVWNSIPLPLRFVTSLLTSVFVLSALMFIVEYTTLTSRFPPVHQEKICTHKQGLFL